MLDTVSHNFKLSFIIISFGGLYRIELKTIAMECNNWVYLHLPSSKYQKKENPKILLSSSVITKMLYCLSMKSDVTAGHCPSLHNINLHYTVMYWIEIPCIALCSTAHCTTPTMHDTVRYCIVMYCIKMHRVTAKHSSASCRVIPVMVAALHCTDFPPYQSQARCSHRSSWKLFFIGLLAKSFPIGYMVRKSSILVLQEPLLLFTLYKLPSLVNLAEKGPHFSPCKISAHTSYSTKGLFFWGGGGSHWCSNWSPWIKYFHFLPCQKFAHW